MRDGPEFKELLGGLDREPGRARVGEELYRGRADGGPDWPDRGLEDSMASSLRRSR